MINNEFYKQADNIIKSEKNQSSRDGLINKVQQKFNNEPLYVQKRIHDEFFGYGPLKSLLQDTEITEIIINGSKNIFFEKTGMLFKHQDEFYSNTTFNNFIHLLTSETNSKIDIQQPHLNIDWQGFRVHIISKPICPNTSINLRRHSYNTFNFRSLKDMGWAPDQQVSTILDQIEMHNNILIVGTTGSGKTTLINSMLQTVKDNCRCVIIEDTSELITPNDVSTKLLTRQQERNHFYEYDQAELIRQSLRMRPERLIVGEVRGHEAKDYLLALSTGHNGGFCSLHASSARQALLRLEMLVQMGAPQWSLETIRRLIQLSLDTIIVVDSSDGFRHLKSIDKIASLETNGITLQNLYKFQKTKEFKMVAK